MTWGKPQQKQEAEFLPESIEELEELRLTLMEDIAEIQAQFASRKADFEERAIASGNVDRYGKPMAAPADYAEYTRWRGSAAAACRFKQLELSNVKGAIKEKRVALGVAVSGAVSPSDADPLASLWRLARNLAERLKWAISPEEQATLDRARHILQHGTDPLSEKPSPAPPSPPGDGR